MLFGLDTAPSPPLCVRGKPPPVQVRVVTGCRCPRVQITTLGRLGVTITHAWPTHAWGRANKTRLTPPTPPLPPQNAATPPSWLPSRAHTPQLAATNEVRTAAAYTPTTQSWLELGRDPLTLTLGLSLTLRPIVVHAVAGTYYRVDVSPCRP